MSKKKSHEPTFMYLDLELWSHYDFLTHLPLDKMAAILQTMFSYAHLWMKSILIKISLKFVPEGPVENNPALV